MINLLMYILTLLFIIGVLFGIIIWLVVWACKGNEDY